MKIYVSRDRSRSLFPSRNEERGLSRDDCHFESRAILCKRRREAFTLVELVVVVSVMSLLLSMVAVLLHGMLYAHHRGLRQAAAGQSLMRLADQFREDVQAAESMEIENATTARLLAAGQPSITYRIDDRFVLRQSRPDGPASVDSRDAFTLPKNARIRLDLEEVGQQRFAVLSVTAPTGPDGKAPVWRATRVEAQLARDHRWRGKSVASPEQPERPE